jgi:hypothetical protein
VVFVSLFISLCFAEKPPLPLPANSKRALSRGKRDERDVKERASSSSSVRPSQDVRPILGQKGNVVRNEVQSPETSSKETSSSPRNTKQQKPMNELYVDDFESDNDAATPLPSYRNFVKEKGKEDFPESFLIKKTSSKDMDKSDGNSVTGNDASRKDKLLSIREKTLERVKQRQLEEEMKRK